MLNININEKTEGTGLGKWTFRSSALSFPGAKSPQMEISFPWNFRSLEKSQNFRSVELSHSWNFHSSGANVPRTLALWNFCSLKLSLPYLQNWVKSLQQSVRRRILAMVVGLRAHVETSSLQTTQYIVDEVDLLRCVKL